MDYKKEYEILDACLEIQKGKIEKLKQENAKLKREYDILDGIIDLYNAKIGQLKKEIKELKEVIEKRDLQLDLLDKRSIKHREYAGIYFTALQEIKTICKMDCGDCPYNQDCDCNFQECEEAKIDDILDLITKAEV